MSGSAPCSRLAKVVVLGGLGLAGARLGAAAGGVVGLAPQEQVNETTVSHQGEPDVAVLADGSFVVVWRTDGDRVWVRVYDADGTPAGGEAALSTDLIGSRPRLARLAGGEFIAVWDDYEDGDVHGRLLTEEGTPAGPVFGIAGGTGAQWGADVVALANGGFLVVWTSAVSAGGDVEGSSIQMRLFDGSGAALGNELQVNTVTAGDQLNPNLSALDGGGFVVVWDSDASAGSDDDGKSVQARRLGADGTRLGSDAQVNSFVDGDQYEPDAAPLPGGGFAVVWASLPSESDEPSGVLARGFRADGSSTGPEAELDASDAAGGWPTLCEGPDGFLLATWADDQIFGRLVLPQPIAPVGDEFLVSDYDAATTTQSPRVAFDERAQLVAVWESFGSPGDDESGRSVQMRRFSLGRVAHWQFEEGAGTTATDRSGQVDDDGTISSAGNWTFGRPGGHRALAFDGDDRVDLPSAASSIDLAIGDEGVSLAAWVFLQTLPSASPEAAQGIYDAAQDNYVLYLDRGAVELRFRVTDEDGTSGQAGIPESMLRRHRWTHVVGVYDAAVQQAQIYLDGTLIEASFNPGLGEPVRTLPAQAAAIGRDGVNAQHEFLGRIEQVEVWRRALLPAEVVHLMGGWIFGDGIEGGTLDAWSAKQP